jgi:hypothetical protein
MARRSAGKANSRSVAPRGGGRRVKAKLTPATSAPPACEATLPETALHKRLAALERERDTLRTALEQERARRRALEKVHAATRDRISWALGSLQAILDARA